MSANSTGIKVFDEDEFYSREHLTKYLQMAKEECKSLIKRIDIAQEYVNDNHTLSDISRFVDITIMDIWELERTICTALEYKPKRNK